MTMSLAEALKQNQAIIDRHTTLRDSIEGFQTQVADLLAQVATLTSDKIELTEQLAVARATIAQDAVDIARLQSDLVARDQTIAEQAARIQELEDQLDDEDPPPPPRETLWGFNVGGYAATKGETASAAYARITQAFGPVQVVRWWPNRFFGWEELANYPFKDVPAIAANLGSDVNGVLQGIYDDDMLNICTEATRPTWLTMAHEPEDDGFAVGDWQRAQVRLAQIKADAGNDLVRFGPLLMGASYHPTRYVGTGPNPLRASERLDFDRSNIDFVGADLYQWGKGDADADHAEAVIGPVRDLALSYGVGVLIGELGARRRSTVSDAIRKRWVDETAAIAAANPGLIETVCYYETDRGAADKVPWNLLPPPGGNPDDPANSPQVVAAYRALCAT